jgi:hypothetical protein
MGFPKHLINSKLNSFLPAVWAERYQEVLNMGRTPEIIRQQLN